MIMLFFSVYIASNVMNFVQSIKMLMHFGDLKLAVNLLY
jgi:hypothetical protein